MLRKLNAHSHFNIAHCAVAHAHMAYIINAIEYEI